MAVFSLKNLITEIKEKPLPGKTAQMEMSFTNRNFEPSEHAVKSAVAIVLFENEKGIHFPLIKRSYAGKYHKGQIALPGGKLNNNEKIEECAARECEEEIGILKKQINPIKYLSSLYIPISNYIVYPVLYYTQDTPIMHYNTTEVEKIMICNINDLLNLKKTICKVPLKEQMMIDVPAFMFQNEIIWGATALILNEFKVLLEKCLIYD